MLCVFEFSIFLFICCHNPHLLQNDLFFCSIAYSDFSGFNICVSMDCKLEHLSNFDPLFQTAIPQSLTF